MNIDWPRRILILRALSVSLATWKRHEFPCGCIVKIGDNYGLASAEDSCPADMLPVPL